MKNIEKIEARAADLGNGMVIRRALPSRQRRMVGAWCFLDHAGPVAFEPGHGMNVGAHPHTALQTFSWLIEGEVLHRDSLGNAQVIRPGQVNLMTAGRGIVHTEESLPGERGLHLAQLWIALPSSHADCEPAFDHYPELPRWEAGGSTFTLLAGSFAGHTAPGKLHSPLVGIDITSAQGGALELAPGTRILLLGGEPFAEQIVMWWNFVGYSREEIAKAQRDWESGDPRFGEVAGHEGKRLVAPLLPWAAPG